MVLLSFYILSLQRVDLSFRVLVIHHSSFIGIQTPFSPFTAAMEREVKIHFEIYFKNTD